MQYIVDFTNIKRFKISPYCLVILFMQCRGDLNITWKNIKMILHGSTTSKLPTEFIYNNNSVLGSKDIAVM